MRTLYLYVAIVVIAVLVGTAVTEWLEGDWWPASLLLFIACTCAANTASAMDKYDRNLDPKDCE